MKSYSLSHLADRVLLRDLDSLVSRDRATTAAMLAHLAEVDLRRLYLPTPFPSMYAWCVGALGMSEDMAAKRIQAARAARDFPAIFPALAAGRLHLSAVVMLAPHLTPGNAAELLAMAEHKTKLQIEALLAERFPRPDLPTLEQAFAPAADSDSIGPAHPDSTEGQLAPAEVCENREQHAPGHVAPSHAPDSPGQVEPLSLRARVLPIGRGRYELTAVIGKATNEKLVRAAELLSHAVATGDVAAVLDRALTVLVAQLEKRRCAATDRPRRGPGRRSANPRHVPAEVVRAVWTRDGGQCAFVGENGQRCQERHRLQLDHLDPVGRGGQASVDRMRLLCRPHNQFMAEREYGAEFVRGRREAAHRRAIEARMRKEAERARAAEAGKARAAAAAEAAKARVAAAVEEARQVQDLSPWLRALGYNAAEARRAAATCVAIPDSSLEERIKHALRSLAPACVRRIAPVSDTAPITSSVA